MSEAIALQATEQCRELIANPAKWDLDPMPGLEPLDVSVKFNRPAAHTSSAFQVIIRMRITLDNGKTWRDEQALVSEGKTKGECLEGFYNRMADPSFLLQFHAVVKAHDAKHLDALAQRAADAKAAESRDTAARAKEFNRKWADRALDNLGRKLGFVKPKVQF